MQELNAFWQKLSQALLLFAIIFHLGFASPQASLPTLLPSAPPDAVLAKPEAPLECRAQELLEMMTLQEKVGQMFFIRCPAAGVAAQISQYHPGGLILFALNFEQETQRSIQAAITGWQTLSEIPLWVGTDEEGGDVVRVSQFPQYEHSRFPSPQTLRTAGGLDAAAADAKEKSTFLLSLGINVNFAPVADVSLDNDDYIHNRTWGADASATADYVSVVLQEMEAAGISGVLKHFPGYGNCEDTHGAIVHDERPREIFETADLLPFARGIEANADFVLVSHNIVNAFDATLPASLSPAVHELLRDELGFDGIIITDDLAMSGVAAITDAGEAAVQAVLAGNDMLLSTDYPTQIKAVLAAVEAGRINMAQIDDAVRRILRQKLRAGLLS